MNTLHVVYLAACVAVFGWATFCILSPMVRDGIAGKILFIAVAIAAASILASDRYSRVEPEITVLLISLALLGVRQFFLKVVFKNGKDHR